MIADLLILKSIQDSWHTVSITQNRVKINLFVPLGFGCIPQSHDFSNLCYSFVLLFAYSVLDDVLRELRNQKAFTASPKAGLKELMYSSKSKLAWIDFSCVDRGREARNRVAHEQLILERGECWKYIQSIENELIGWRILPKI